MPRTSVEDEEAALLRTGERRALRFWEGFTELAMHGNILQIALGMIFASMFTNLVTSLVSDVMLPPMSVLFPLNRNLEEKFAVLQSGPNRDPEVGYTTLKFALEDGAVVLAYGMFLSKLFHFLGVGLALYSFAMAYQYFSHDPIIKRTVSCRYCCKKLSYKAVRCVNCTSWQDGREERMYGL